LQSEPQMRHTTPGGSESQFTIVLSDVLHQTSIEL